MSFLPFNESKGRSQAQQPAGPVDVLQLFRSGPLYRALVQKRSRGSVKLLVQHDASLVANLLEKADSWIANEDRSTDDFSSAVLAKLVDVGLDRALIGAIYEGKQLTVYMSDRIGKLFKEVPTFLSKLAEADLQSSPDGNNSGLYIFSVRQKPDNDFSGYMSNLLADMRSGEDTGTGVGQAG